MAVIIHGAEDFERACLAVMFPRFESRYQMLRWEDLDTPGPEMAWLVEDLLTEGDKSIIGGPSRSGKSFIAIDIGMAIATGREFFGKRVASGLVIYQAGEGARGIKNRLRAYRQKHNLPAGEAIPFVLLQSRIDLYSLEGDTLGLIEECRGIARMYRQPLKALFIDTLAKAQGPADENSGKDMGQVLDNVDRLQEALRCHVCLVHHLNADGTKLRGHTSVLGNLDEVLGVTRNEDTGVRTLKTSKVKDGADDIEIKFELGVEKLGEDEHGKPVTSCVVLAVGEKELSRAQEPGAVNASPGERSVLDAFFKARDEHGVPPPPASSMIPMNVGLVVEWKHIRQMYYDRELKDEQLTAKEDNRIRQALHANGKKLRNRGILGVYKSLMWWTGKVVHGVPQTYTPRKSSARKLEGSNVVPLRPDMGGVNAISEPDDDGLPF